MKILIIGGGSIGKRHIANLQALGYHDIVLLKREYDAIIENELGVKVIGSFVEASKLRITHIIVCTPTALHNESLAFAIANSCAVFMEKPLVGNKEELNEALGLLSNYSKPFFIGFMLRYHPLVNKLKNLIDDKSLGEVFSARFSFGSYLPHWHPWEDYKQGYAARKELGGGVINTISHELDLIQHFFGNPKSVLCNKRNLNKLDIEVEEIADAIFGYEDKVVTLHLDYLQKDYQRQVEVLCDKGRIFWDWHANEICVKKHNEAEYQITLEREFDANKLYLDEMDAFLELVGNKVTNHPLDQNHAIANMSLILSMHESAEFGKKVKC